MEKVKSVNLFDLRESIAAPLLEKNEYPWEVLPEIGAYIKSIGPKLDPERFEQKGEFIWIAKE